MSGGYESRTRESRRLFERAKKVFAGGVNHNARFFEPYPFYVSKAKGKRIWDEDGNVYTDYWMGHMALIMGHSPGVVVNALAPQVSRGTHYGVSNRAAVELGEEVQRTVPSAEMLRFCNSGAEATMYLVRFARAATRKRTILKIAGGWHGYNTELNYGVHGTYDRSESAGILPEEQAHIRTVRFNDLEAARKALGQDKDVAAIFLEPVLGAGGCIPARPDYLKGLRELADERGALLAFDEIITGFRVALGGAQERYGVKPDLSSLGKVLGGGLPIGAVCGRAEIISKADPKLKEVSVGGGTFSENPLSMAAGLATLRYLRKNRARVYGRLESMGSSLRIGVARRAREAGVVASATGMGSLFLVHFAPAPRDAEQAARPDGGLKLAYSMSLMAEGVFNLPGHPGAVSTAHTDADVAKLVRLSGEFFEGMKKSGS